MSEEKMICPHCGAELQGDSLFCCECGERLVAPAQSVCPACGAENPPDALFCGMCGTRLAGAAAPAAPVVTPEPAPVVTPAPVAPVVTPAPAASVVTPAPVATPAPVVTPAPVAPAATPAPAAPAPGMPPETATSYPSEFKGGALANLFLSFFVVLFSLATLGLLYPVLMCAYMRWETNRVYMNGRKLEFDGHAAQLYGKFLLWLFLSLITFGIYLLLRMPLNLQRWKISHTHVAGYTVDGKKAQSKFTGTMFGLLGVNIVRLLCLPFSVITLGFMGCVAKRYRYAWFAKRRIIDGQKVIFDGNSGQLFGKKILWTLALIFSIGIYSAWYVINIKKWRYKHTHFATPAVFPAPVPGASIPTSAGSYYTPAPPAAPSAPSGASAPTTSAAPSAPSGAATASAPAKPYFPSSENSNKSIVFCVLTFFLPIPLVFPILARVYGAKAKQAGEPNGGTMNTVSAIILALYILGIILSVGAFIAMYMIRSYI